jgi:hypothetical protein
VAECAARSVGWRSAFFVHILKTPYSRRLFRYYVGDAARALRAPCTAGTDRPRRQARATPVFGLQAVSIPIIGPKQGCEGAAAAGARAARPLQQGLSP